MAARWLRTVASVAFLGFAATAGPALVGGAEDCEMEPSRAFTVAAPRSLRPGEAYALLVETGELAEGDVLMIYDAEGETIGSVAGNALSLVPQRQIVALIEGERETFRFSAAITSSEGEVLRAPCESELLKLELVPMEITP